MTSKPSKFKVFAALIALFGLFINPGILSGLGAQKPEKQGSALAAVLPQSVKVVSLSLATQVVINQNSMTASLPNCLASGSQKLNFVQDSGPINLNQAADCFSLAPAALASAAIKLSVKSLAQTLPKINIAVAKPVITSPNFLPAPITQGMPILPLTFFALEIAFALWGEKVFKHKLAAAVSAMQSGLVPKRLEVLRC